MPSFEENLNFIFNTENKSGSAFYINKNLNLIDKLEKDTEKIPIFNESKIEMQVKNLKKILSTFRKKLDSMPAKVIWIRDEAEKLCKIIKKPEDMSDKTLSLKSDILADKMSFCFTNLFFMNDILEYIKNRLNLLFKSNGKCYPSSVLSTVKDCLKRTEEYNITKLKHAQKKFYLSKELGDFMYGKKNPKLANLLSLDSSVPVDKTIPSKLMTPFGPVWVKKHPDESRMIYLIYLNQQCSKALKYDEMCRELDFNFNPDYIPPIYIKEIIQKLIIFLTL